MRLLLCLAALALVSQGAHAQPAPGITPPQWLERPTGQDFARAYPSDALRQGVEARVVIACTVDGEGRLQDCTVASEDPPGFGFDVAALEISREFRMSQTMENGASTEGGTVRIPLTFRLR
jgi:protein TonB